jgi:hypothetical protein
MDVLLMLVVFVEVLCSKFSATEIKFLFLRLASYIIVYLNNKRRAIIYIWCIEQLKLPFLFD